MHVHLHIANMSITNQIYVTLTNFQKNPQSDISIYIDIRRKFRTETVMQITLFTKMWQVCFSLKGMSHYAINY